MLAYRLVHDVYFFKRRSFCPKCNKTIVWYDNIPVISWALLLGKCRNCKKKISLLYPFIEFFSTISLILLFYKIPFNYFISYFIFFSALIITIRTDIETMLISRFVTIFLIPLGLFLSYYQFLPITFLQSLFGTIFGFLTLSIINKIFFVITKKHGLGQGDAELLSYIGSFTGICGCWFTLLIGSILGSIIGIFLIFLRKFKISNKIPFGPFLAIGAIIYILYKKQIFNLFLNF